MKSIITVGLENSLYPGYIHERNFEKNLEDLEKFNKPVPAGITPSLLVALNVEDRIELVSILQIRTWRIVYAIIEDKKCILENTWSTVKNHWDPWLEMAYNLEKDDE